MSLPELPLAQRYARFRASVFDAGTLSESQPLPGFAETMPEMQLQSLWFAGEFGTHFTSTQGHTVQIRDFGLWNSGAGPDFKRCAVLINGEAREGDIELDPSIRDWEHHHHGSNADYDGVVLHLFVIGSSSGEFFTRTSQHREVVQVQLSPAMLTDGQARVRPLLAAHLGRCARPLQQMGAAAVRSLIEAAAQHRLQRKATRLHRIVAAHGREQAVFQELARALGYARNQRPFTVLTQRLSLKRLLKESEPVREALLFGLAGFTEAQNYDEALSATRSYLLSLWSEWWKCRDEFSAMASGREAFRWDVRATRPGNHPQRRLGALAALVSRWSDVMSPLRDAKRWDRKAWVNTLTSLRHSFWDLHYTLSANPAKKPIALLGDTRAQEMLANIAYPLLMPESPELWSEYRELPMLLENKVVDVACMRLFGDAAASAPYREKLHQQQGLLQLYEDFCLEDHSGCEDCPFPERLMQWT